MWKMSQLVVSVVSLMLLQIVSSRRTGESMSMARDGNLRMEEKSGGHGMGSTLSISIDEILEDIERVVVGLVTAILNYFFFLSLFRKK